MYVVFQFDSGMVACHSISCWMIFDDGDADINISGDEPLFFRNGQWRVCGYPVEILEMEPDLRRFLRKEHGEKNQAVA